MRMCVTRMSASTSSGVSSLRLLLCRFLGRRVAAFQPGAVFAGVREAPRHEIAGSVREGLPTVGVEGQFSAALRA